MEKALLVIDGGGTKTKASLFLEDGSIVYEYKTNVGSFAVAKKEAMKNIDKAIEEVIAFSKEKYEIIFIQMGISGLGAIENVAILEKRYYKKYKINLSIDNDVFLALYSVIKNNYNEGIVIVSGTGSGIGGIKNGRKVLIGGYGHLLDEYGSAYSFVRSAILFVKNEYELTGKMSIFGRKLLSILKLENVYQFKAFMYNKTKYEVASFSKAISLLALENNDVVTHLLENCALDLFEGIKRLKNALNLSSNAILGFRGGFICDAPLVKEKLISTLEENGVKLIIDNEFLDPIYGGYYMRKDIFK